MFFEYPALLWLLAIPALLCVLYIYRQVAGKVPHFRVSSYAHPVRVVHGGIGPYNNMYG